ncbi:MULTISPECIES: VanZ family protein [Curtobacterium]|uniref:VanZ family protein n=2 Tax=Curtobacterium TaxID=2034 RepID=A0A5P8YUA2_9MICO|nr:VanZ family protein [Curtobacterium flaccumfaciens]MBO9041514.1 VanZ family protein [Curtobacterium flaccumfaciens pv. flaccumfaciens]MBO9045000.1 VanZ family protein [Curtobacterium flaccumfaciens pv. flaccumfaciens]MBO9048858.1 VanZ family protein [Curtobacterium flaccumfaciens pv. flaccumfaciens]MBO9057708.1 VanZ family protein [Curtobacterium flaccumfaciens pv. flaccumfaciens]MBT1543049.1 VanZ family protein [Curtobacterium flaccumfaciens pv. flaccumfaciens]
MISTFLVEHATLVRIGFWVAVAAATVLAWVLHWFRLRRVLLCLSAVALVAVLVLTLLPDGARPGGATCTAQFSVPFQGIDTLANVAMLLPLVLFLGTATNRPLTVLAGAVALSAVIELVQALAPVLGRRCDTNDWFMNSVGAVLGAVIALVICAIIRRGRTTAVS